MALKELAYRTVTTPPFRRAVRGLGRWADVPDWEPPTGAKRYPLQLCVTVDTEGGYVDRDESRIWQGRAPDALQGYVHGVQNLVRVFDRHGIKATFLVAPHGASADLLRSLDRAGHEIGLHLHPTSDRAIAARLGRSFDEGSAVRLSTSEQRLLVDAGKSLLEERLGRALDSFRWGNWGLDASAARIVAEAGFRIDSSAVPRIADTKRPRRYDWSDCSERRPWAIAPGLQEVPIATFRWLGRWLRADPIYGPLLDACFDLYRERAPRDEAPFPFVVMTHSCEATYRDGSSTRTLADLDRFLARAVTFPDVEVVPLRATSASRR